MFRILSVACFSILITGCAPKVKEVIVERTVTKYAVIDDRWLKDCPVLSPAEPDEYRQMSLQEQVDFWSGLYIKQIGLVGACNIRLDNTRNYNALKKDEVNILTCKEGVCK